MSIVVVINQVPDTEAVIKIDSGDSTRINEEEIKYVLNPYDEYAVEEAIVMSDDMDMETIAVCIGTERAESAIRSALAMGIDRAILIYDEAAIGADPVFRGEILAAAIKDLDAKIILTGRESIDRNDDSITAVLGEKLNFPHVNFASKIEIDNDSVKVFRDVEGGSLEVNASLPVVISCQKGLNDPRYPNLIAIKRAKNKEMKVISLSDMGVAPVQSRTRVSAFRSLSPRGEGIKVSGEPEEVVTQCVEWMSNKAKVI